MILSKSNELPILIDLDGFFKPVVELESSPRPAPDYLSMLPVTRAEIHRICQVHFLFRSTYNLTVRSGPFSVIEPLSQLMLLRALEACAGDNLRVLEIPDWADFFCDSVKRVHGKKFPVVYETELRINIQPRLHAWSVPRKREVHVSALTRELLLRINVLLVNASDYFDPKAPAPSRDIGSQIAKVIISYLMASYDDLNYSRFPTVRTQSPKHFHKAMLITKTQVEFMISHEFGHIALDLSGMSLLDRENRCDDFAFDVVKKTDKISDVFTALRWLFIVVSIERLLGEILYKAPDSWTDEVDWLQNEIRSRDRAEKILAENKSRRVLSWTETAGSLLLFSVKEYLREIGPVGVRQMVSEIRRDTALPPPSVMKEIVERALVGFQLFSKSATLYDAAE